MLGVPPLCLSSDWAMMKERCVMVKSIAIACSRFRIKLRGVENYTLSKGGATTSLRLNVVPDGGGITILRLDFCAAWGRDGLTFEV